VAERDTDKYGRIGAELRSLRVNVGEAMVRAGFAWLHRRTLPLDAVLRDAELAARY
jgi:endonuclease YncB( thermonuclease family)